MYGIEQLVAEARAAYASNERLVPCSRLWIEETEDAIKCCPVGACYCATGPARNMPDSYFQSWAMRRFSLSLNEVQAFTDGFDGMDADWHRAHPEAYEAGAALRAELLGAP